MMKDIHDPLSKLLTVKPGKVSPGSVILDRSAYTKLHGLVLRIKRGIF